MLAAIPYTTFPTISLGGFGLRTFGFMVAIGVLLGAWLAARHGEAHGVPRDTTYALAMRMVLGGVIGSRITWVLSHTDQIDSPLDVIAIWQGGLQFSGGFIFAVPLGYMVYRKWNRLTRWHSLDGYAYGLAIGLAFGRVACYSVGEHFGRVTNFFLAVRYDGGSVREGTIGDEPLREGMVFHHAALYEMIYLLVLFLILTYLLYLRKTKLQPGTAMALFCGWYGVWRFWSDSLRANDERVLQMTGAQYLCIALVLASFWIWFRVRKQLQGDIAAGMVPGIEGATPVPANAVPLEDAEVSDRTDEVDRPEA
ncbi:MAG: prolipoprotein diacylglyceryl transferase [Actinomycetota bacterium]|nr:prolipoprotein diacylglyceryl transferase [Actinomycetota bacterium]